MNERRILTSGVSVWLALLPFSWVGGESLDSKFLAGLRERGLYTLAEAYCDERLRRLPPGHEAQSELTVEWIRTLAEQAVNSPPPDRALLWSQAQAVADRFFRQSPLPPRAALVRFQAALALLAQGELERQELESAAPSAERIEATRQLLRQAAGALEAFDKDLQGQLTISRRSPPRPLELNAAELDSLSQQAQQQLARVQRNRALLYEAGSDDRLSLLLRAIEILNRVLPQVSPELSLRGTVQLDLAECERLLGRWDEAADLAAAFDQDAAPATARSRARAERIRVALGQNNLELAKQLSEERLAPELKSSPELDLARLEALLALSTAAENGRRVAADQRVPAAELAKQYQHQAAQLAESLEQSHGHYWGGRAGRLLLAAVPRGTAVSAELLGRAADDLYLQGRTDEALAAYDDAAHQARARGDHNGAFQLAYKAALVEQQRKRNAAAATRLRILAKNLPTHRDAAAAHLLAAWNVAQDRDSRAASDGAYQELLAEHLAMWPTSESADQARLWLGQKREAAGDWPGAIAAYAGVSRASSHFTAAIAALVRATRQDLATLAASGKPTSNAALEAISTFRRAILGPENRWPERWTEADRTAALAAAELIAAHQPGSASDAEDLLRRALAAAFDAPPAWRTAAQAQLVVALAAQGGRQDEALAELRAIRAASPDQMLAVLDGLSRVAAAANERSRASIARLQLAAVAMLTQSQEQLNSAQRLTLDRVAADANAALGRRDAALATYEQLAKDHPDQGSVQEGYARLLLSTSDPQQLQRALDQWRRVASRAKPQSPRWLEAKYSVALAQQKLGDRAGAAKLLRYLLEAPPGLKGSEWEAKYAELLRQCER